MSLNDSCNSNQISEDQLEESGATSVRYQDIQLKNAGESGYLCFSEVSKGDQMLKSFQKRSKEIIKEPDDNFKQAYIKVRKSLHKSDQSMLNKIGTIFSIEFLEHSHYIYTFRSETNQEDTYLLENRLKQFEEFSYPQENIYLRLLKTLDYLSKLMIRWKIFNVNEYCYRFKGRGLTVKMLDMDKINSTCLSPDIIWFSLAIRHQPFFDKIDKVLQSYAKILQSEIDQVFEFIRITDLSHVLFRTPPKFKFFRKQNDKLAELYHKLRNVEMSYRYFEKNLIQELLKNA